MAKLRAFRLRRKPLARPVITMMGTSAVSGLLFSAVINSLPDILRHLHVGHDQVRAHSRQNFQRFHAIGGRLHRKSALLKKAAHGIADQHGVVDDQRDLGHTNRGDAVHTLPGPHSSRAVLSATSRKRREVASPSSPRVAIRSRFRGVRLFDVHVFEFAGLEDLAALLALDELGIFVAADDLHARMFARLL